MLMRRLRTFTPLGSVNGVSLRALLAICNGVGVVHGGCLVIDRLVAWLEVGCLNCTLGVSDT